MRSTIQQGSKGPDVTAWQKIIGVTADGDFGPGTKRATVQWQTNHGLSADGVVGPHTWGVAEGTASVPVNAPAPSISNPSPAYVPTGNVVPGKQDSSPDLNAIYDYFSNTAPHTAEADTVKNQFFSWYAGLNWLDRNTASALQDAQAKRDTFNKLNGSIMKIAPPPSPTSPAATLSNSMATIQRGSKGAQVVQWQKLIGVPADGHFGPGTQATTKNWQSAHGLPADGIVNQASWSIALQAAPLPSSNATVRPGTPPLVIPMVITGSGKPAVSTTGEKVEAVKGFFAKIPGWLKIGGAAIAVGGVAAVMAPKSKSKR